MLPAERDADDRNKKQNGKNKMNESCVQATGKYPDYIKQQCETAARRRICNNLFSEGQKLKHADLEALNTKWNTNDSNTKNKAHYKITKCGEKASAYEPDKIAKCIHGLKIKSFEYLHFKF